MVLSQIYDTYASILQKYNNNSSNTNEYTVLAAIIAAPLPVNKEDLPNSNASTSSVHANSRDSIILSLATGTKCIGIDQTQKDSEGFLLKDSHAEVLAKRGLQRYIWKILAQTDLNNDCIFEYEASEDVDRKLKLKSTWSLQLFTSDSPCGDASIYHCDCSSSGIKNQIDVDNNTEASSSKPQFTGAKLLMAHYQQSSMNGESTSKISPSNDSINMHWTKEENQQQLGQLRTKSGRRDLPMGSRTLSKSCTDKICKWLAVGMQGSVLSNYCHPIRLSKVIICRDPSTATSTEQTAAFQRAVIDRIKPYSSSSNVRTSTASSSSSIHLPEVEVIDYHDITSSSSNNENSDRFGFGKAYSHYRRHNNTIDPSDNINGKSSNYNINVSAASIVEQGSQQISGHNDLHHSNSDDNDDNPIHKKPKITETICAATSSITKSIVSVPNTINENKCTTTYLPNKQKPKDLKPSAVSFNWIHNVDATTNTAAVSHSSPPPSSSLSLAASSSKTSTNTTKCSKHSASSTNAANSSTIDPIEAKHKQIIHMAPPPSASPTSTSTTSTTNVTITATTEGASLEITQAHDGILLGTIKKNRSNKAFCSRLSRCHMRGLCEDVVVIRTEEQRASNNNDNNNSINDSNSSNYDDNDVNYVLSCSSNNRNNYNETIRTDELLNEPNVNMSHTIDKMINFTPSTIAIAKHPLSYTEWKDKYRNTEYAATLAMFKKTTSFECWDSYCLHNS